jgi:hypothetical protein
MSANVGDALLVFCLGSSLRLLRGEGENGCILPFTKSRQQHGLAIGELERVMIDVKRALVDLAKDRNGVLVRKISADWYVTGFSKASSVPGRRAVAAITSTLSW